MHELGVLHQIVKTVFASAKTGNGVDEVADWIVQSVKEWIGRQGKHYRIYFSKKLFVGKKRLSGCLLIRDRERLDTKERT